MKELKGIIAPVPTPFNEAGFVLPGSTGEFVYLTTEEKKAVFERGREVIPVLFSFGFTMSILILPMNRRRRFWTVSATTSSPRRLSVI